MDIRSPIRISTEMQFSLGKMGSFWGKVDFKVEAQRRRMDLAVEIAMGRGAAIWCGHGGAPTQPSLRDLSPSTVGPNVENVGLLSRIPPG